MNRYLPPGSLIEVTCRTLQGRGLLTPSRALNQIVLGVMGRAQRHYGVLIHALIVMSNHYHMLVTPPDGQRLADFMGFVNSNLSKEVGRLRGWRGPLWHRRYDSVPVSEEEAAQVARLKYLLSHGCKEDLVMSPSQWPGVHCVDALAAGTSLIGIWYDRSRAYEARRRNVSVNVEDFGAEEEVHLTPIPAWSSLSPMDYSRRIREMVDDIAAETESRHRREGTRPLGVRAILKTDPESKGNRLKRRPKPRCHAATQKVRLAMIEQCRAWLLAYRAASEGWRRGFLDVVFPPSSFRPGGGWVRGPNLTVT